MSILLTIKYKIVSSFNTEKVLEYLLTSIRSAHYQYNDVELSKVYGSHGTITGRMSMKDNEQNSRQYR